MSINFGTWLYEALTKLPEDHRKFFLTREDQRNRFWREERCTGLSSDALTLYALRLDEEPQQRNYPSDHGDLDACERTYQMAPADLQERMLPVLEKYRIHVAGKYPESGPSRRATTTGLDPTPCTTTEGVA